MTARPHSITITRDPRIHDIIRNSGASTAHIAAHNGGPAIHNEHWSAFDTTNIWQTAVGGTGTAAINAGSSGESAGRRDVLLNCPAAADVARLSSRHIPPNPLGHVAARLIYSKTVLEWEAIFASIANVAEAQTFMGFLDPSGANQDRRDNGICGFTVLADVLKTLTDNGGTETETTVGTPPTTTNRNKYKIVLRPSAVDFYVNDVLKNTHTTNLPSTVTLYPSFVAVSDAGLTTSIRIGHVRCYILER